FAAGARDHGVDLVDVADIGDRGERLAAGAPDLVGDRLGDRGLDVVDDRRRAVAGERDRARAADAAAGAGDQGDGAAHPITLRVVRRFLSRRRAASPPASIAIETSRVSGGSVATTRSSLPSASTSWRITVRFMVQNSDDNSRSSSPKSRATAQKSNVVVSVS